MVLTRAIGDVIGQPKQKCAGGQRKQGKITSEDEWVQRIAKCVDPFEVGAEKKDEDGNRPAENSPRPIDLMIPLIETYPRTEGSLIFPQLACDTQAVSRRSRLMCCGTATRYRRRESDVGSGVLEE